MRGDAQARTHDDSSQMIVDKGVVSPLGLEYQIEESVDKNPEAECPEVETELIHCQSQTPQLLE